MKKAKASQLLRKATGVPNAEFRPDQWESIERIVNGGGRHLVVQRTGWGKSLVYFMATRILRDRGAGPTLVISPLLALMRDQQRAADRLGLTAVRIDSSNRDSWSAVSQALQDDEADLLFISPERLANRDFLSDELPKISERLELLVIDEAHCISDWGHDFRPDYRRIRSILNQLPPGIRLLTVTATANQRVVEDLVDQLGPDLQVSRGLMVRDSLALQAIEMPTQLERMAWLSERIPELDGAGIIYVLTKRDATRLAAWLCSEGVQAEAYFSGSEDREGLEERLLRNDLKVLVATTALAMGFDKPDLGFVIHYQRPQSLVHYYQQVGRAGRAIDHAMGVLLTGEEDRQILEFFINTAFPEEELVQSMMRMLRQAGDDGLSMTQLQGRLDVKPTKLAATVKFLTCEVPAPITYDQGRVFINPIGGYQLPLERFEAVNDRRYAEADEVGAYIETDGCLMQFLQRALGDTDDQLERCGRCASCVGHPIVATEVAPSTVDRARAFLGRQHIDLKPRKKWPSGFQLLDGKGWSFGLRELQVETGRALCHYSDPVYGVHIRRHKTDGVELPDSVFEAIRGMIQHDWRPDPMPQWVAAVPSLRNPTSVPDIAERIAGMLGLPCHPEAIRKVHETSPQKTMQNSWHQARNIFDAFSVTIPAGLEGQPLLLVDDMVDSRWTFTVIGALLREAGAGAVYPLAIASTAND